MAKFLPLFGEVYTTVESGILLLSAGLAKNCGNDKAASELTDCAGKAWKEYSETNASAIAYNWVVHKWRGDKKRVKELEDTFVSSVLSFVDSIPVFGHAKGVVHYTMGDVEKGKRSMKASTRNLVVLGAGIATGGLGAGLVTGAAAGIGAGVAYDATVYGSSGLPRADKMNPNEFVGSIMGVAVDGLTGASGAQLGRNIRTRVNGQRALQDAYKGSDELIKKRTDYRTATKITMEAAEESKKAQGALNKPTAYATCQVVDSSTGHKGVGHSGNYNKALRAQNYESLGYKSKTAARNDNGYGKPSHLQTKYKEIKQVLTDRPQAGCAEHPAFDNMARENPNYNPRDIRGATVFNTKNGHNTAKPCDNCRAYNDRMGTVLTDCIPDRTPVPSCGYVRDGFVKRAVGGVAVGCVVNNDDEDETDSD